MKPYITNFMDYNLVIIVVQNLFFIGSYGIDINVFIYVYFLNINVMCIVLTIISYAYLYCLSWMLYVFLCCLHMKVVYTTSMFKWHSCLSNTNPWNNKFHTNLKRTYEACKFVMYVFATLHTSKCFIKHFINFQQVWTWFLACTWTITI